MLIQSFVTGAVGFAVFQYMSGADIGYLDVAQPKQENVLCLADWPLRHNLQDWASSRLWEEWAEYRTNMTQYVERNKCPWLNRTTFCSDVNIPLSGMGKNLGIPLGTFYFWGNDAVEVYGYLFLWLTVCMWFMVTVHDLALLTLRNRNFVLDLQGIRRRFPCWQKLWILVGFRCWKRLFRGRGLLIRGEYYLQGIGRMISIVFAPVFVAWGLVVFHFVIIPIVTLFFMCFPIRLSRILIFLSSLATGVLGVMLTVHSIVFLADVGQRQTYAVTWNIRQPVTNATCACGCIYPLNFGRCLTLLLIGVIVAYKAFVLAFRCLKGLRRSNWANLMSVLFPVPLTVYEVMWTQPDGKPIQHRQEGDPVQGEIAFDPFALMDEQPDSGRTTLTLVPTPINPENEPVLWSADDVSLYLQELGLGEYCDAFAKNEIDGATLLDILRSGDAGLHQLGVTSPLHISKIRARLTFLKSAIRRGMTASSLKHAEGGKVSAHGATPRRMSGPSPVAQELPPKRAHLEYIGCCGFPCRRGEHRGRRRRKDDTDSDDLECASPKAGKEASGANDAINDDFNPEDVALPVVPHEHSSTTMRRPEKSPQTAPRMFDGRGESDNESPTFPLGRTQLRL